MTTRRRLNWLIPTRSVLCFWRFFNNVVKWPPYKAIASVFCVTCHFETDASSRICDHGGCSSCLNEFQMVPFKFLTGIFCLLPPSTVQNLYINVCSSTNSNDLVRSSIPSKCSTFRFELRLSPIQIWLSPNHRTHSGSNHIFPMEKKQPLAHSTATIQKKLK